MQKITIALPESLYIRLTEAAESASTQDKIKVEARRHPPVSQLDWLAKTPEGKQFTHDCMTHKLTHLSQAELNKELRRRYYATYGLDKKLTPGRPKTGRARPIAQIRSELVASILLDYYGMEQDESNIVQFSGRK